MKIFARYLEDRITKNNREKIGEVISLSKGKILDLGSGEDGSFDYKKNRSITSFDKYSERVTNIKGINKVIGDLDKKLPFKKESYEVVVLGGVIQYIKNPNRLISEISRVTKKKGVFVMSTVNRNSLLRKIGLIKKDPKKKAGEKNIFTIKQMINLLRQNNFKICKIKGSDFFPFPKKINSNFIIVSKKE